jgi:conjugal transfer pilus assembly protein TrbC
MPIKADSPSLLIFVSFSLPMASLKSYAQEAQKVGAALVFRGLLENSFIKTAQKIKELGSACLIDPTLFERYRIQAVPTFVLRDGKKSFDTLKGHISLKAALQKIAKKRTLTHQAQELLQKLEGTS